MSEEDIPLIVPVEELLEEEAEIERNAARLGRYMAGLYNTMAAMGVPEGVACHLVSTYIEVSGHGNSGVAG